MQDKNDSICAERRQFIVQCASVLSLSLLPGVPILADTLSGRAKNGMSNKPFVRPNYKDRENKWRGDRQLLTLWRGDRSRREVALTFDDGPHPPFTQRLLDLLKQLDVTATFFLVGKKVDQAPGVVARMRREGHEVANHTYHHINLDKVSQAQVEEEIKLGNQAVKRACGITPTLFRPPGGHHGPQILEAAKKLGMTVILWTDDPADFAMPGVAVIQSRIMEDVSNGSDILLHDGVEQTLEMLPDFIAVMRQQGYQFVKVSEMTRHVEAARIVRR